MRKRLPGVEDMDDCAHVDVNKANQLEVAGGRECDCVGLPVGHLAAVHTCGAIEGGSVGRCPWASNREGGSYLPWFQEGYRVILVGGEGPGNAVAGTNPDLTGKIGE